MNGLTNTSGFAAFTATNAFIAQGLRVQVDANGLISAAGATDPAIGVTEMPIAANGKGTVKLFSAPGTFAIQANTAVACGAALYPAAGGRVDDSGTTGLGYVALNAAAAQGDLIECTRFMVGA